MVRLEPARWSIVLFAIAAVSAPVLWLWYACARDPDIVFLSRHRPARWITYPLPADPLARRAVELDAQFRRSFTLSSVPDEATLEIRALRRFEILLNDRQITFPDPNANWKVIVQGNVAEYLYVGENTIVVTVEHDRGPPVLWLCISTGGEDIRTDHSWEVSVAGSVWQPARLASEPMATLLGAGHAPHQVIADSEIQWLWFVLCAGISGILLIGVGWTWQRLRARSGSSASAMDRRFIVGVVALLTFCWCVLFWNNRSSLALVDGFDAPGHLAYIQYVLDHRRFPWPDEGWSMFHPPLFYGISAFVLECAGLSTHDPAARDVLQIQALVFAFVFLLMTGLTLRWIFPSHPLRQLIGLILAGFLPMHLYLFQFVTNETLAATLVMVSLYVGIRMLSLDRPALLMGATLGLCLGAAMLTKFSALIVMIMMIGSLIVRAMTRRRMLRAWLASIGMTVVVCFAVCGWRFIAVWWRFGNPIIGNWDPRLVAWWQDPGYQTAGYFVRFGRSLFAPIFSGYYSFADGIYSTLWGDGLISGYGAMVDAPPWNFGLMTTGYWLALLPTVAVAIGVVAVLVRFIREPSVLWLLLGGLGVLVSLAVLYMSINVPSYAHAKALYAMPAVLSLFAFGALGFDLCTRRSVVLRWVFLIGLGVWAVNAYASFWIPGDSPRARARLGWLYAQVDGSDQVAEQSLRTALAIEPTNAVAQLGIAELLDKRGQIDQAVLQLHQLLEHHQGYANGHLKLAALLTSQHQFETAIEHARCATALAPNNGIAWFILGQIHTQRNDLDGAVHAFRQALRVTPEDAEIHHRLGLALAALGQFDAMQQQMHRAIRMKPDSSAPLNDLAWILSTHDDANIRQPETAVRLAQQACELTGGQEATSLDTLAAAYAASDQFERALVTARKALDSALEADNAELADQIRERLKLYGQNKPYREVRNAGGRGNINSH